jgi:hypothetical protein
MLGKAVISKEKSGGFNTPPELLFEKIKSLDDATAFRYKELENIHNFLRENNILEDTSFKDTPTYNNILYSLVRNNKLLNSLTSNKTIKTSDGEKKSLEMLNKTSAENLLKSPNAQEMLKFFPELKTDLKDAIKKQSLIELTLDADGQFVKSLNEQGALAKILQYDDPSAYMAELLRSKQPITSLTRALKEAREYVAKNSKGDALKFTKNIATIDGQSKKVTSILNLDSINNGFKEAILTHVLTKSGMNQGGRFNPQKAYALLFEPMAGVGGRKRTSLSMWMKNSGLIDDKQLKLFRETLVSMSKIDVQMRGGDINIDEFNAFQNFTFGVLGSVIGTGTQKAMGRIIPGMGEGMGPGSIIAANQGAQLARNIFMAIPESLRQSAMIKVMSDPQLFLQLNKEIKEGAPLNYFGALLGALKKASLIAGSISLKQLIPVIKQDEDEGKPPFSEFIKQKLKVDQDSIPPDEASVDLPEEGFPTTQTAMVPPSGLNTRLAANVGTAPQAAPNTALRQQFASVFPNDPISGLINAQQPPRLMAEGGAVPPRQVDIKGQPHMLAYITPQEGGILQLLGGSGAPGPMGIPSFADIGGGPEGAGQPGSDQDDDDAQSSVGEDTGYSGSISDAMSASAPSAGPGVGVGDMSNITSMGLDSSIADMAAAMAGLSRGLKGTENVQGSVNYSPVGPIAYDIFNLRDKMNQKARESLTRGVQPSFTRDAQGNITSVTGPSVPGASFMGIPTNPISALAMIGNMMGATTTTGYDPSLYPGGDPDSQNGGIANLSSAPVDTAEIRKRAIDLYNMDPNKYRLFGS